MKTVKRHLLWMGILLLVACGGLQGDPTPQVGGETPPPPLLGAETVVTRLQAAGAKVEIIETVPQQGMFDNNRFDVELTNLRIAEETVRVFVFGDVVQRQTAAAGISPAGDQITEDMGDGTQRVTILETVGTSHVWADDRFLLWYFGADEPLISLLDGIYGAQIADGSRINQPGEPGSGPIMGLGPAAEPPFDGLALQWDPYLAHQITIERLPEQSYDPESQRPYLPERIVLTLHSDKFPNSFYEPQIFISGEPFAAVDTLNGDFVYFAESYVNFSGGGGSRWIASEVGQAANPVLDGTIYYLFKGRTADFSKFVYARIPLASPLLPASIDEIAGGYDALLTDWDGYRVKVQNELAAAPAESFTPQLQPIDDLLASLQIDLTTSLPGVTARGFAPFPELSQIPASQISPADSYDYWALRVALAPGGPMNIASQNGDQAALDPAVVAELAAFPAPDWCGRDISPSCLFDIVVVRDGQAARLTGPSGEIAAFLGTIETPEEALLLLKGQDYSTTAPPDLSGGSWRPLSPEEGGGFEIFALRRTRSCDPIEIDRYLLHITPEGELRPVYGELWSRSYSCI